MALRIYSRVAVRCFSGSASGASSPSAPKAPQPPKDPLAKVTGLSEKVLGKVGPGRESAAYKVPEYFQYGRHSYHEAEIELGPYRCPQPKSNRK